MKNFNNPNLYRAFGLNIKCTIPLAYSHGMSVIDCAEHDVCIYYANVPNGLDNAIYTDKFVTIAKGKMLLKINNLATYYICDGKEIIIQKEPKADDSDVAIFAFGTAMGVLLHQRGIVAIHGSAVQMGDVAIVITGNQGAGKSTLAAALSKKGWRFLSDDICAIHLENGLPYIYPGLTRAKLTKESFEKVTGDIPDKKPLMPLAEKYGVEFYNNDNKAIRLSALCVLEKGGNEISIESINGANRLTVLIESIYRPEFIRFFKEPMSSYNQYLKICSNIKTLKFTRTSDLEKLDELVQAIENNISV